MFLSLKNIGIIETADIELNAITVIAGENSSGKSTIGKALYSVFNSFFEVEKRVYEEKRLYISQQIEELYHKSLNRLTRRFDTDELAESIINDKEKYIADMEALKAELANLLTQSDSHFEKYIEPSRLSETAERIANILNVTDYDILLAVLQKKIQAEFSTQISNLNHPRRNGEISLKIKDSDIKIRIRGNENITLNNGMSLNTEAIYIDDPYVVDNIVAPLDYRSSRYEPTHRDQLRLALVKEVRSISIREAIDEIIVSKKLDNIFEKLNTVCAGEMVKQSFRAVYKDINSQAEIDIGNVSTGLKTFVIIKSLLLNGSLVDNGILILDEPEIHLHPEWQLVFAELIVLIQIEFNMHILLNTHSPYFLNAIEVYSRKYGIANKCKYYLAELKEKSSTVRDVTDNIEDIYLKLARPLQNLENEGYINA